MGDQRCAAMATFITVCTFALSGTLPLRAIWIEIPALSRQVPEGSNLYIYVLVISECSNIAAVVYLLTQKCSKQVSSETRVIYAGLMLGITSMVTLGLFWRDIVPGLNAPFSFTLLLSVLLASIVASVSTVAYIPFVSRLKASYMSAAMAGEALSSLIPHVLATVQGIGRAPDCFTGGSSSNSEAVTNASSALLSSASRPTAQTLTQRTTVIHLTRQLSLQFSEQVYFLAHAGFITLSLLSFIVVRCSASFAMTAGDQPATTNVEVRGQRSSNVRKIHHGVKTKEVWQSKRTISRPTTVLDDGTIRQSSILLLHPSKQPDRSSTAEQAPLTGGGVADAPLSHSDDCETASETNNQSLYRASHPVAKVSGINPQRRYSRVSSADRLIALKAAAGRKPKLFPLLMVIVLWSSFLMNGPLSSVYSYSCFSVGNNAFLVGVILCDIFTLFSCLLSSRTTEMSVVIAFTCLGTILLTYFLALIIFSLETQAKEFPPFNNTGEILAVGSHAFNHSSF